VSSCIARCSHYSISDPEGRGAPMAPSTSHTTDVGLASSSVPHSHSVAREQVCCIVDRPYATLLARMNNWNVSAANKGTAEHTRQSLSIECAERQLFSARCIIMLYTCKIIHSRQSASVIGPTLIIYAAPYFREYVFYVFFEAAFQKKT